MNRFTITNLRKFSKLNVNLHQLHTRTSTRVNLGFHLLPVKDVKTPTLAVVVGSSFVTAAALFFGKNVAYSERCDTTQREFINADVYRKFSAFIAQVVHTSRDNIDEYNASVDAALGLIEARATVSSIDAVLGTVGWTGFVVIALGVAGGAISAAALATFIAINPTAVAVVLVIGSRAIYLMWESRVYTQAIHEYSDQIKPTFEKVKIGWDEDIDDYNRDAIEELHDKAVRDLLEICIKIARQGYH